MFRFGFIWKLWLRTAAPNSNEEKGFSMSILNKIYHRAENISYKGNILS